MTRQALHHLRNVAFDLEIFLYNPTQNHTPCLSKVLTPFHPEELPRDKGFSNDVKSITLLLSDSAEVISITLDDNVILKPGEWSYPLDTQSQLFAE